MTLPSAPGSVHYVQTPFHSTPPHRKIVITFRIDSLSDAIYSAKVDPEAWDPATFHVFIERRGDDLTNEFYRWGEPEGFYVLGSQDNDVVTIQVPLTVHNWTSVLGRQDVKEFNATLNDLAWVGIVWWNKLLWARSQYEVWNCTTQYCSITASSNGGFHSLSRINIHAITIPVMAN
jgi:hypothetical protein